MKPEQACHKGLFQRRRSLASFQETEKPGPLRMADTLDADLARDLQRVPNENKVQPLDLHRRMGQPGRRTDGNPADLVRLVPTIDCRSLDPVVAQSITDLPTFLDPRGNDGDFLLRLGQGDLGDQMNRIDMLRHVANQAPFVLTNTIQELLIDNSRMSQAGRSSRAWPAR
jgi:hypothetical protein